jgi:hypothetical protein
LLAGNDEAVEQLTGLSASQQLSTADLQPLILQAISKASRWSSSLDPAASLWCMVSHNKAMELLKHRNKVIELLLAKHARLPVSGPCPAQGVCELLQACILHGLFSTARTLLQQPAAQQMDGGHMEQLLLTYFNVDHAQLRTQQDQEHQHAPSARQVLELLLQHPAAAALDAAALGRLIVGHGVFAAAAASSKERQRLLAGTVRTRGVLPDGEGSVAFDPVELLVGLPAVQQYDAAGLASVLAAAVEARVSSRVFELLYEAPGTAALDAAQLRQLLGVCAQHYNGRLVHWAFIRLLQHPAAPGRGDSQVQLYAGMLGC